MSAAPPSFVTPADNLRTLLGGLSKLFETFSADLLKATEIVRADKTQIPGMLSALDHITNNSKCIASHLSAAQAYASGELRPMEVKKPKPEEKKKTTPEDAWTICDRCEMPCPLSETTKRLGKDYCAPCHADIKARDPPKAVRVVGLDSKDEKKGSMKDTLTTLNVITEAKRQMQKFASTHTILGYNVDERLGDELSSQLKRNVSTIEKLCGQISQLLCEMEVGCNEEILRQTKAAPTGLNCGPS